VNSQTRLTMASIATQVRRKVAVEPGKVYPLLGVRWYGKGAFLREEVTSETAKARHYYQVRRGDLVYNRLFAWKASFAVIPPELDGRFVSSEFPLFQIDPTRAIPEFILLVLLRQETIDQVLAESTGSTSVSRNRWREEFFFELDVDLPPIDEQRRRVDALVHFDLYLDSLRAQLESAELARRAVAEAVSAPDWDAT
jgi:type I restriction enzyme S subunit